MKNRIKKWLGISKIEKEVFLSEEPKTTYTNIFSCGFTFGTYLTNTTLVAKHKQLREDFEELDNKFDKLEQYLQIEYFKNEEETQIYDWADKVKSEGFRKASKTYKAVKEEKSNL